MLIDSHAHLDDEKFDNDRDKIIKDLNNQDIELVINPGSDVASSVKAISLAKEYDNIYAAVGVHPHDVKDMDDATIQLLSSLANNEKVVAIGEIGLDYHYDYSPRDAQKKWFIEQIRLAKKLQLPIIVHEREASQDMYNILKQEADGNLSGVLHCYSGSLEMAKEYLKMGFYLSFAGPVTFKNSRVSKEVAKNIPLDRMLIETDSPYLAPEPKRGKRNEPLNVRYVAAMIAELRQISFDEVAIETNKNTKKLFFNK
ncbi:TatD family hydrolase [Proteiniborus sp.]|uniref:TatD family hydrolase n=1 Tax=Proteiniborus sp. TaxID=2079015 RepID=UPI003321371F